MSKQDLITVVQRSIKDPAFRRQLSTDTTSALRGYTLTNEEIGALRARDTAKLTAFGVDVRMSKVFTIDQGSIGNATLTSSEPRDVAPVWIGDGAAHATVQTPDAGARNLAYQAGSSASGGVQSPDAAARNLNVTTGSGAVQSPDAADRNLSDLTAGSGGVQSPDAMDRNLSEVMTDSTGAAQSPDAMDRNLYVATPGSVEPRDTEPTWIGDTAAPHTYSGDDNAGPEIQPGSGDIHNQ